MQVPDVEAIVVSAGGEVLIVGGPFEAADFLPMCAESPLAHGAGRPYVPLQDQPIPATGGKNFAVPRESAHSSAVTLEFAHLLVHGDVPDLEDAILSLAELFCVVYMLEIRVEIMMISKSQHIAISTFNITLIR